MTSREYAAAAPSRHPLVALVGNPNTGKTTLFNALAGMRQRVGNYPGVTVETKKGRMTVHGQVIDLIDLPGTYSLAPRSPDEMLAVDVLLGQQAGERRHCRLRESQMNHRPNAIMGSDRSWPMVAPP